MSNAEEMKRILDTSIEEIRPSDQTPDTLVITEDRLRRAAEIIEGVNSEHSAAVRQAAQALARVGADLADSINAVFRRLAGMRAQVVILDDHLCPSAEDMCDSDESEPEAAEVQSTTADHLRAAQEQRRQRAINRARSMPSTKAIVELINALLSDSGSTLVSLEANPIWTEIELTALELKDELREVREAAAANQGLIDARQFNLFNGRGSR